MAENFYSANTAAFIYMGTSTATPLPAPGADTFTVVPLTGKIKVPGLEQSTGGFNVLNDTVKRAIGGKLGDRTVDVDLVIDWQTLHAQIKIDCGIPNRQRNWRIIYPDNSARQLDFVAFPSKWDEDEFDASADAKEHHAQFTLTVNGAVTETP